MILARLKSETATHHARAEAAMPPLEALARPVVYRECLRTVHAFHAVWEPAIWSTPGVSKAIPAGQARRKLTLLARDLAALCLDPLPIDRLATPRLTCATALGALYVLEGASLGGRVITRQIAGPLGMRADSGLAYFSGYGELTGARWKEFGAALEAWAALHGEEDAIVAGARRCFEAFEHCLRSRRTGAVA